MKRIFLLMILGTLLLVFSSCLDSPISTPMTTTACPTEPPVTTSVPATTKSYEPITDMAPEDAEIYVSMYGEPDHMGNRFDEDVLINSYQDSSVPKTRVYEWQHQTFELEYERSVYAYHQYRVNRLDALSYIGFDIETGMLRILSHIPYERVGITYTGNETEAELIALFWNFVDRSYEAPNFSYVIKTNYSVQTDNGEHHAFKEGYYIPQENETLIGHEISYRRSIAGMETSDMIRLYLDMDSFSLVFDMENEMKDDYFAAILEQKDEMIERVTQYVEQKFSSNYKVISVALVKCHLDYVNQVPYLNATIQVKYENPENPSITVSYQDTVRCTLTCYQPQYKKLMETTNYFSKAFPGNQND